MLFASQAGRIFRIASSLAVMFLHFICLRAVKPSIKSKIFGELEGYDTSMSMEHIHKIVWPVSQFLKVCSYQAFQQMLKHNLRKNICPFMLLFHH